MFTEDFRVLVRHGRDSVGLNMKPANQFHSQSYTITTEILQGLARKACCIIAREREREESEMRGGRNYNSAAVLFKKHSLVFRVSTLTHRPVIRGKRYESVGKHAGREKNQSFLHG